MREELKNLQTAIERDKGGKKGKKKKGGKKKKKGKVHAQSLHAVNVVTVFHPILAGWVV